MCLPPAPPQAHWRVRHVHQNLLSFPFIYTSLESYNLLPLSTLFTYCNRDSNNHFYFSSNSFQILYTETCVRNAVRQKIITRNVPPGLQSSGRGHSVMSPLDKESSKPDTNSDVKMLCLEVFSINTNTNIAKLRPKKEVHSTVEHHIFAADRYLHVKKGINERWLISINKREANVSWCEWTPKKGTLKKCPLVTSFIRPAARGRGVSIENPRENETYYTKM